MEKRPGEDRFLVFPIFPKREVHLLTGESGTGKSTFFVQLINSMVKGEPVLGFPCDPQKVIYISNERTQESIEIDNDYRWNLQCPFVTLSRAMDGLGKVENTPIALLKILSKYARQGYTVAVIDPIVTFCKKPNDQNEVHNFLFNTIAETLKRLNITVLASGHPAKEKQGQKVLNTRTKTAGSQGWGSFANTVMHMELTHPEDPLSSEVLLVIKGRHCKVMSQLWEMNESGVMVQKEDLKEAGADFLLSNVLEGKEEITRAHIVNHANNHKFSASTVDKWIREMKAEGRLMETEKRGVMKVNPEVVQ